jgi:hypothetical protein
MPYVTDFDRTAFDMKFDTSKLPSSQSRISSPRDVTAVGATNGGIFDALVVPATEPENQVYRSSWDAIKGESARAIESCIPLVFDPGMPLGRWVAQARRDIEDTSSSRGAVALLGRVAAWAEYGAAKLLETVSTSVFAAGLSFETAAEVLQDRGASKDSRWGRSPLFRDIALPLARVVGRAVATFAILGHAVAAAGELVSNLGRQGAHGESEV